MSVRSAKLKVSGVRRGPGKTLLCLLCLLALACGSLASGWGAAASAARQQKPAAQVSAGADAAKEERARAARPDGAEKRDARKAGGGAFAAPNLFGCAEQSDDVAVGFGTNRTGNTLASGDCASPADGSLYDVYTFTGNGGQYVTISMTATGGNLNPYIYLLRPGQALTAAVLDEPRTVQNNNGWDRSDTTEIETDALLIGVLPETGTYTIIANSFNAGETGSYDLRVTGGCAAATIGANTTPTGTLGDANDCRIPLDNTFVDVYSFNAAAGQRVSATMTSSAVDPFMYVLSTDGFTQLGKNDDESPDSLNARFPAPLAKQGGTASGQAILPSSGNYYILANLFPNISRATSGAYALNLTVNGLCPSPSLTLGQPFSGQLSADDCRLPLDSSNLDSYTFAGTAGQQIAVTMNSPATTGGVGFDAYLYLLAPDGFVLDENDDVVTGGSSTNARIPAGSGFFTLPVTGNYRIYANSVRPGLTGTYTVTVTGSGGPACTYALTPGSREVPAAGGTFDNTFTTQAGCPAAVASNSPWIVVNSSGVNGSGSGTFNYAVQANGTGAPRSGTITVGGQTFTVTQAGGCQVSIYPAVRAFTQGGGAGRFTVIPASSCTWTATTSTPWITISAPTSGAGTGRVNYTVAANTTAATRTGTIIVGDKTHTVTQTAAGTTPAVSFSNTGYAVVESDGSLAIRISVSRTGADLSGASTVEYRTVDNAAAVPCNPQETAERGTAYARCDYATTVDTLTFEATQATKEFLIPLINDVHVEGTETFQIALSNPQGATLGATTTAAVTIVDDDNAQPTANPVRRNNPTGYAFFVRQQYLDFLSREPDTAGFNAWVNLLTGCANPDNVEATNPSAACDRIIVSQSFFESGEFALKGRFVFLFYKAAFARNPATGVVDQNYVPEYEDIVSDMRRVTGATGEEVIAKRLDFADDFVARPAFAARYNALTPAQYVDTLLGNVGAALATPDPANGATRDSLVTDLTAGTKTRSDVLRLIAESQEANAQQFKHAYVAMQYYGYLRRKPEPGGYQDFLNAISPPRNAPPREMVNAFLNSREYRWRFGPDL